MPERDCNTCAFHKQGQHPPELCRACLASPGLPVWMPKGETLEVSDVSAHTVVSDYVPLPLHPNPVLHTPPHKVTLPPTPPTLTGYTPVAHGPHVGQKHDNGKPPMDFLDKTALEETARVLAFGAKKYAAHNWRKGLPLSRTLAAALRHIYQFLDGETNDAETGLNHLGHAMCEVMFALNASKTRPDLDDRYRKEAA